MELHQFSDTVQELCHEGHSLARVSFNIDGVPYVLKSIEVTPAQVTFRLQTETSNAVHSGFLALRDTNNAVREKSSKSLKKS